MSSRAHRRALVARDQRRQAYDSMQVEARRGDKRPGSLNPRKPGPARKRRK